jgi:hypothetical protein
MTTELTTVEVLPPAQHEDLRREVISAKNASEAAYWRLATALHTVWAASAYQEWGYASFNDYVDSELDMQRRKAQYLVAIADWFGSQSNDVQDWVKGLGWTKARELVGVVDDSNAAEWQEVVEGASLREISEAVKTAKTASSETGASEASGEDKPKGKRFMLFEGQMSNVEAALTQAKINASTEKEGHALDMICTEYLAGNGALNSLQDYLSRVEQVIGRKLIAFAPATGEVEYGAETLDEMFPEED